MCCGAAGRVNRVPVYDAVIVEERQNKRPTLRDVARVAGVSHQTVSRAINDKGEIDPETRRRVLEAARELRYRPSRFGRGLVRPEATTVGLIVPDVVNPFFPELIAGVLAAADKRGWQVVIGSSQDEREREPALVRSLAGQVDALIGYLYDSDDAIAAEAGGIPLVVMSRRAQDPTFGSVDIDSVGGVRAVVAHLAGRGHDRIGMIDCPGACDTARRATFETETARLGLGSVVVGVEQSMAGGQEGFTRLHAENPGLGAVFAFNDVVALGAHRAVRALGLTLPDDVALAGFDGLDLGELLDPPLTTVSLDKRRMGELAVAQVEHLLAGEQPAPAVVDATLVIRGSA